MLLLRNVQKTDLRGLMRLAAVLNTVNLPHNHETLRKLVDLSLQSFTGKVKNPFEREYLFVLEDVKRKKLVGTSMIIAQHGTHEAPHIYYDVTEREHYSASLNRHFRHQVLSIGYNYDGPTEVGGLVVDPPYRSGESKPGKQLSYVRFLFMAMNRSAFRDKVLAELLPPLLPDGRSLLWEAIGKKFTGLTYQEADRLSRKNKEFIKELFPQSDIYASLFPARTREHLGEVGPQTRGVQRMLERIGFRYAERVDPFDGGPHFEARVDDVSLIRAFQRARVDAEVLDDTADTEDVLVGIYEPRAALAFRALRTLALIDNGKIVLSKEARQHLHVRPNTEVGVLPFQPRVPAERSRHRGAADVAARG